MKDKTDGETNSEPFLYCLLTAERNLSRLTLKMRCNFFVDMAIYKAFGLSHDFVVHATEIPPKVLIWTWIPKFG